MSKSAKLTYSVWLGVLLTPKELRKSSQKIEIQCQMKKVMPTWIPEKPVLCERMAEEVRHQLAWRLFQNFLVIELKQDSWD